MKTTKVELIVAGTDRREEFEIEHAERLLRLPNNGGWELPKDSKYQFSVDDGITTKRDKNKD